MQEALRFGIGMTATNLGAATQEAVAFSAWKKNGQEENTSLIGGKQS